MISTTMPFIANAPGGQPTGQTQPDTIITNDGFFPDIDLAHMRDAIRLDGTVTDTRLTAATVDAIIFVNDQVKELKTAATAAGHTSMAAIPAAQVNRQSVLISHYLRAVYCTAKADLIERYKDYDTTATSLDDKKLVGFLANGPDEERRNAAWAISKLMGRHHVTVELI
ncbi:head completion/stabilization protein [Undibacterium sp. SXout7W]|uniref:head completion/stabilization protein n=1 Tax=Undibacterium sp. SXout7W TaxID=3413049 RepID=UPI003BF19757